MSGLRRLTPLVTASALAACSGGARSGPVAPTPTPTAAPPAAPTPAPMPPAAPAPTTAAAATRFALLPGSASYDVRTDATVEMTAGPSAERGRESVATSARVGYELTASGRGLAFTGLVEGFATQGSSRVIGGAVPPSTPVRFRGLVDARSARLDADSPVLGCLSVEGSAQQAALGLARETVLRVPATIAVGARWRDSVSTLACRGPIPATAATAASYEIVAIEGTRLRVRRDVAVTLRGGGIAGGRSVTLTGAGSGTATIELDAALGRLIHSAGETRTTITVTLPDGPRQFTQQVKTQVQARDGR